MANKRDALMCKNRIYSFDPRSGKLLKSIGLPAQTDSGIAWNFNSERAAAVVGEDDPQIHIFDLKNGTVLSKLPSPFGTEVALGFCSESADQLALFGIGQIAILDVTTRKVKRTISVPNSDTLFEGAFSRDGRLLSLHSSPLTIWEIATGRKRFEIESAGQPVGSVFSNDSALLASWNGGRVLLFNVRTSSIASYLSYPGDQSQITAACFSPDGKRLATGTQFGSIVVWNVTTGEAILKLEGHESNIKGLIFSADSSILVSTSQDSTALVWNVATKLAEQPELRSAEVAFDRLGQLDAALAQEGIAYFHRNPAQAVTYLSTKIPTPVAIKTELMNGLLLNLASEDYQTREKAAKELVLLGREIGPGLSELIRKHPTQETLLTAKKLLEQIEAPPTRPDELRIIRTVEILEGIGSAAARATLQKWSAGPSLNLQTIEATEALRRLR